MKSLLTIIFFILCLISFAQQKKPNSSAQQQTKPNSTQKEEKKITNTKSNTTASKPNINKNLNNQKTANKPKPQQPQEPEVPKEPDYSYIKIDTICSRCKGYRYYGACDGLYCYSGACSSCKGYRKCIHCAGTQLKNTGLEGCPDCTDGNCRICRGSGLCAKCEGTGKLICSHCGGTGYKTPEQREAEKLKKIEEAKRRAEEWERKRLIDPK